MNKIFRIGYLSLLYLFLYTPIAVVVWFSFNNADHSLLWHGFTWRWYQVLSQDTDLQLVAWHSLCIGVLAASAATVLAFLAAISLFRYQFTGKKLFSALIFALIVVPDLVLGVSFILLYRVINFPFGFASLLIAHITFCTPFACVIIASRIQILNKHLFEAAQDLGANEWVLLKKIALPLLLPSLIAGWLLSFTLSLDDVIISYFVSGPNYEILPLKIFSMVKLGVSPEINALASLLLVLTFAVAITSQILLSKKP